MTCWASAILIVAAVAVMGAVPEGPRQGEAIWGRQVMRQAFGGLLWSKQFYYYDLGTWLKGDAAGHAPPDVRKTGRNHQWSHVYNDDIISMPDKWEYPWYAAWDLAFHCIALALVDAEFAKEQLLLTHRL